jgi:hypothetical protein
MRQVMSYLNALMQLRNGGNCAVLVPQRQQTLATTVTAAPSSVAMDEPAHTMTPQTAAAPPYQLASWLLTASSAQQSQQLNRKGDEQQQQQWQQWQQKVLSQANQQSSAITSSAPGQAGQGFDSSAMSPHNTLHQQRTCSGSAVPPVSPDAPIRMLSSLNALSSVSAFQAALPVVLDLSTTSGQQLVQTRGLAPIAMPHNNASGLEDRGTVAVPSEEGMVDGSEQKQQQQEAQQGT